MSDENNEKVLPEGVDETDAAKPATPESEVPEAEAPVTETTETETSTGDDWQWDAAVPETQTDNISFDDLAVQAEVKSEEPEAEKAEDAADAAEDAAETVEAEPKKTYNDEPCIVCGNPIGESPSDLYCSECREKFLRTDYGVGHIIFAFVMVIAAVIGYFVFFTTGSIALKVSKAEDYINKNRFDDAVNICSEVSEDVESVNAGVNAIFSSVNKSFISKDWFNAGGKTNAIILGAYADVISTGNSEHETFVSTVESKFVDKNNKFDYSQLEKPGYEKIKNTYDFCKGIIDASNSYIQGLQEFVSYNDDSSINMDYPKAMAYIDTLKAESQAEKCMADYCRFLVSFYAKKDNEETFGYYDSLCKNAGDFEYIFWQTYMDAAYQNDAYDKIIPVTEKAIARNSNDTTAYYYAIQSYIFTGDMNKADAVCEDMKKNNPEGLDYYGMKAGILRRSGDFEGALQICKQGLAEGEDPEIYRQQAIVYMLTDKQDEALEAIKQCYELELQNAYSGTGEYVSLESLNTAALITCICGDEATYKEIVDLFESEGISLEKSVQDCIKGETTFEDIFMKGTGEV